MEKDKADNEANTRADTRADIRGFIFDMDGTLLDTERLYYRLWQELKAERGFILTDEMLGRMRGAASHISQGIFEEANPGWDFMKERELRTEKVFAYVDAHGVPKKPGMDKLFRWLHARRYRIALASSSPRKVVMHFLEALDYVQEFDFICYGEMVQQGKPAPDIFLYCMEKLGLLPEQCCVVEDSVNGILAGSRSGAYVIGIQDLNDLAPVRKYLDAELGGLPDIIRHFA